MFQCSNKTSMLLFLLLQVVLIVAASAAHAEGDEGVTCHAGWDKTGVPREHVDEGECRAIVFIVCTLCSFCVTFLRLLFTSNQSIPFAH